MQISFLIFEATPGLFKRKILVKIYGSLLINNSKAILYFEYINKEMEKVFPSAARGIIEYLGGVKPILYSQTIL